MNFVLETIRLGLTSLRLHMLRSVLTSLGIILGVAAVIIMVSIGEGKKQAALRDIQSLGATNIIVRSSKPPESNTFGSEERTVMISYGILFRDFRRLENALDDVAHLVPLKKVGSEISCGPVRTVSQTFGTTPALREVANLRVARGRYLTPADMESTRPVAVIGADVAEKFFPLDDPIGETFRVDDQAFRVVGILKPVGLAGGTGSALVGRNLNDDVHIPLTTARSQFGDEIAQRTSGSFSFERVELSEVFVTARSTKTVLNTAERVQRIMRVDHDDLRDIKLIVPWELLEQAKQTAMAWNIVLVFVAAISLVIGGIGIMNIMLATVTERTREIGIRRALGATRKHIAAQFLMETGTIAIVGGLIGILFGIGVSSGMPVAVPWLLDLRLFQGIASPDFSLETQLTGWSIIASFLVAAIVGLVFGIYPAIVASRQDPIVALRHD